MLSCPSFHIVDVSKNRDIHGHCHMWLCRHFLSAVTGALVVTSTLLKCFNYFIFAQLGVQKPINFPDCGKWPIITVVPVSNAILSICS